MASDEKKNGRISIQTVIAGVAVIASLGGSWWAFGQHTGEMKQRLATVEQRQAEDRRDTKDSIKEVKENVRQISSDVQVILRQLNTMEALQRQQRRDR